jgi:hypothetical protein
MRELHREIARICLEATMSTGGVALGGGNALLAHGISERRTNDVDLFITSPDVSTAVDAMIRALTARGYQVAEHDKADGLRDIWPDATGLAELEVTPPRGGDTVQVQASHFELLCEPVRIAGIGDVVALDDAAGWKTVAAGGRRSERDLADIASLIEAGYTPARLISLAMRRDQGLTLADYTGAALYLDRLADSRLARVLPPGRDPGWVRKAWADWPRSYPR